MTAEKKIPGTRVTEVARLMADVNSCAHRVWFLSRYSGALGLNENGHDPIDRDPRRNQLTRKTFADLEERGHRVYPRCATTSRPRAPGAGRGSAEGLTSSPGIPMATSLCMTSGMGSPPRPTTGRSGSICTFCPGRTWDCGVVAGQLDASSTSTARRDGSSHRRSTRTSSSASRPS